MVCHQSGCQGNRGTKQGDTASSTGSRKKQGLGLQGLPPAQTQTTEGADTEQSLS